MVLVLVRVLFGAPITAYRPLISDEVTYWHQAFTFSVAGFHGGYYTLDEVTNPSGVTPFGPHGPGFPVLYGLAGTVVGWQRYSVVMLHLIALAIAGGMWACVSRVAAPGRIGPLLVVCLILSNLASANVSLRTFEASRRDHFTEDTDALRLSQAIDGKVAYRSDLSRWCNTLLTSRFPTDLIAIPPGIGLSVLQNPERIVPRPRSRYLLLDESAVAAFRSPLNVDPIVALPYGTLYVNRDADCDGQQ
jgi:hypothetical protein